MGVEKKAFTNPDMLPAKNTSLMVGDSGFTAQMRKADPYTAKSKLDHETRFQTIEPTY